MPPSTDHVSSLVDLLRSRGPASARELAVALGVSQPTISRALAAAGSRIVRWGQTNRARYAARRDIRGLGSEWPLFRIDTQGQPHEFGQLAALYGSGTLLTPAETTDWLRDDFVDGLFPGVPWFLDDQRPQGFLGRQFAQRWSSDLGLPADIQAWDDDAVLFALLLHGDDGPGNFVLGEASLQRALQVVPDTIPVHAREEKYAVMAEAALAGESVGSSAAGEQPKFTTTVEDGNGSLRHVIVKFSEPVTGSAAARRWADLLIAEHLASESLAEHGNASAHTEIVWSGNRLCLEVTRFDRVGAYGRRGVVTLAAWSDAHDGQRDAWPAATARMQATGWVDAQTQEQVRQRWWFGRMIGNTDMHFGNLSFFLDSLLRLELTPSYDMLPMLYRPSGTGAVVPRQFEPAAPLPADFRQWALAATWAELYWGRVSEHTDVSDAFRRIADGNRAVVAALIKRFPFA